METTLFAIICVLVIGFWVRFEISLLRVKRSIFEMNLYSNAMMTLVTDLTKDSSDIEDCLGEIKEILTEASRLKAMRESGLTKEPEPRQAVRGKRFIGVAERRRQAEAETMKEVSKTAVVHNNNVRAMEGK
jgi:hypothetical protein